MTESPRVAVGGVEVSLDHLIDGERVAAERIFECRSPLDWDRKLADVARGDAATAERAVGAAVDGFATWSGLPVGERAAALRRLADLIEARNDDIALVETLDMGFLHRSMRERLVARGALNFRFYADMAEAHAEPRWPARGTTHTVQRMPAGTAVVITPWNAPFMLATWKVAPALAAGNSVV
ncbi:MAG: aldehyde dehydrogenase family protein, partial [Acidimicrobiaceae bacterium]|nr:aldehyde dehydrogenase family protein [Acidimicrobiaceae bacterium]